MRAIQLYAETPEAAVEREPELTANPNCQRCGLCDVASSVCMRAAGEPGGALLIGDYPGAVEDRRGVPFTDQTGRFLHRYASSIWSGPLAVDNAIRCYPKKVVVGKDEIEACRGYLAHTIRLVKPTRIVAMGGKAIQGVLGRAVPLMSVRRGYGWLYNADINDSGDPIPVFQLFNPVNALRNKFMRKMFEADLRWALSGDIPAAPPWEEDCYVIENRADSERACEILRAAEWFSYDCEAVGVQYKNDYMVIALAACARGSSTVYVWDREALYHPDVFAPLADILRDPSVGKTGQNLKYDSHAVDCAFNVELQNYVGDARLQRRLLAADVDASLDVLAELVGLGGIKHEAEVELAKAQKMLVKARKAYRADPEGQRKILEHDDPILLNACINVDGKTIKPKTYTYGLIDDTVMLRYNARDALTAARACELMETRLDNEPVVKRVWTEIVSKANFAIKTVERWGIPTRLENVISYQNHLDSKMQVIKARFDQYEGLQLNSPKSVGDLLYKQLGLQAPKTTETGENSTDHETLEALRGQHAVIDDLLEWRRLEKLRGFAKGIERHVCSDGRIHASFKIDGTRTGRLSSTDPNLQNISRPKDEDARFARNLFVAEPGWELLEADYGQLELRVGTMLSQDPEMLKIWLEGVDYHQRTAELVSQIAWGIPSSQVTSEHRSIAKTINFGSIYGMTAATLAKRLGCSVKEAEKVMAAILGKFEVFDQWCKGQIALARRTGFVWTWWAGERARRRPLFDIVSQDYKRRSNAENAAKNTCIQGCLPGSTKILTSGGYLSIQSAPSEGVVWTGNSYESYKKLYRGEWELGEIELSNGQILNCDTRHEVLVVGRNGYEFKKFENLKVGDRVCRSLARALAGSCEDYSFSKQLAYWMGFAIGNGCTSHGVGHSNSLVITFGDRKNRYTKEEKAAEFRQWLASNGYSHQTPRVFENKITIIVENKKFKEWWVSLQYPWGKTSKEKCIPGSIWAVNLKARQQFLLGLLDADGTVGTRYKDKSGSQPNLHMAAEILLREVQIFASALGIESIFRTLNNGAFRLDFNGCMLRRKLGYGFACKKLVIKTDLAPRFAVNQFLLEYARAGKKIKWTSSERVLISRCRCGGSTNVYKFSEMCEKLQLNLLLYATSKVVSVMRSGKLAPTWTLSVNHHSHRFDTEGVISKNTASDFCLASITELVPWLIQSKLPAQLVLTVHDSIMFHARSDVLEEVAHNAQRIMTQWESAGVPLVVDMKRGESWGSLEDYKLAA